MKKKKFKFPKIDDILDWIIVLSGGGFVILAILSYFGVI